jgi:hypothetical protein
VASEEELALVDVSEEVEKLFKCVWVWSLP